ncbi:hypothetical protein [Geomicrobium sp. JCM 19055]|uniref:hypothetical protein n=1 Tax=Geomicrobium sp. JCM 19055 TaxID=1460649 RepID=UPI00045ED6DD|nr:hypothetical protein [Geomicrobium sp. JCM 19055]GAK00884.1 hypothetical protein JCM19055_4006 [Geomicrobium sp. JCM 19055]
MSLVSKPTELTAEIKEKSKYKKRGSKLEREILNQMDEINSLDYFPIKSVEKLVLEQKHFEYDKVGIEPEFPEGLVRFSPSSADKCDRELFFKANKAPKDKKTQYPFQRRWTRNSTAVHDAVQKQLLESEVLLENPQFTVNRKKWSACMGTNHCRDKDH